MNNVLQQAQGDNWVAYNGDSAEVLQGIPDASIHLSVYSPPFRDLFTYSSSERDLGNSRTKEEFDTQYLFIIHELLRITKPGRITAVHTMDLPALQMKDGYIGLKDFPGDVIRLHEKAGWIYHGWALVAKNPQAQAIRVKARGLAFGQLRRDSTLSRPALLDRVLFFIKPGDNDVPVHPVENGEIDNETWIDWAGGIWTGIQESDTLQFTTARDVEDEKHICPLALGTIERCVKLYSNPGEVVLTPFGGIGSEGYQAVKFGRKAILSELKESYFRILVKNMEMISAEKKVVDLFSYADSQEIQVKAEAK